MDRYTARPWSREIIYRLVELGQVDPVVVDQVTALARRWNPRGGPCPA